MLTTYTTVEEAAERMSSSVRITSAFTSGRQHRTGGRLVQRVLDAVTSGWRSSDDKAPPAMKSSVDTLPATWLLGQVASASATWRVLWRCRQVPCPEFPVVLAAVQHRILRGHSLGSGLVPVREFLSTFAPAPRERSARSILPFLHRHADRRADPAKPT